MKRDEKDIFTEVPPESVTHSFEEPVNPLIDRSLGLDVPGKCMMSSAVDENSVGCVLAQALLDPSGHEGIVGLAGGDGRPPVGAWAEGQDGQGSRSRLSRAIRFPRCVQNLEVLPVGPRHFSHEVHCQDRVPLSCGDQRINCLLLVVRVY